MQKIIRVPVLPMRMVNAHLIIGDKGCVAVDAGLPGSESRFEKVLAKHGKSIRDIKLIVITHAHVDHAGAAYKLREISGAPILAHHGDLPYYKREVPMTFCHTGWAGKYFKKLPLIHEPYDPFEPDILLENNQKYNCKDFGVEAEIMHTPGHTSGSVSVMAGSNEVLAGDMLASGIFIGGVARLGRAIRPPFEDDPRTVGNELKKMLDSGMTKFYVGHGGPLNAETVRKHAERLVKLSQ